MVFNQKKGTEIVAIFLGNYFVAALFSLSNSKLEACEISALELGFAILAGFLFLYNLYLYNKNIKVNGLSLSVGVMRSAVLIPILISIVVFFEKLSLEVGLGIAIVLASFWLISGKSKLGNLIWLLALFLITGATDLTMKVISEFGRLDQNLYLFFLFSAAFVFTLFWILIQKRSINTRSILYGFALGIPNQLSSLFFLRGLMTIPASIAFPLVASGVVLISIICDAVFWKRKFVLRQRIAFALLLTGIVLINLR
jgi:uncharacterized membrane protein